MVDVENPTRDDDHAPNFAGLRALIFDVDGTLYRQSRVRRRMLYRLLRSHLRSPLKGVSTLRILRAYRRAQETLRTCASEQGSDIANEQLRLACARTGVRAEAARSLVARWMEQEPLDLLAASRHSGLVELLDAAKKRGLLLGVFSDYPAQQKLAAMKLDNLFDAVVCAQDPDVQRFKPDPRGLRVTLDKLGVETHEALYIGDRAGVDEVAAAAAGMRCVLVCERGTPLNGKTPEASGKVARMDYRELAAALWREDAPAQYACSGRRAG